MKDNARKLRQYEGRSSIYQWLKTVAIRFALRYKDEVIENESKESLYPIEDGDDVGCIETSHIDIEQLLSEMKNKRYAYVICRLIIDEETPQNLADEMNISVDNLYNIKKRAMVALTRVARRDIINYGKKN